jgi:hypothetical protein
MPKKQTTKKPKVDENGSPIPKAIGLFDHVNHIRKVQSHDYYDTLSDADRKSFNHFMILRFLSMDRSSIDSISSISKYQSIIPSRNFYTLCTAVTNKTNSYFPYIKSSSKSFDSKLIELISKKFEVSLSESKEYCQIYMKDENGINELRSICKGYGLTDKEVDQILTYE